jgi:hypothetical protein
MYSPKGWPKLATDLKDVQDSLATYYSGTSSTKRSLKLPETREIKRQATTNDTDPAPTYAIQAITCADSVDAGDTTTKMVFDELVRVTKDVSQMCELMF